MHRLMKVVPVVVGLTAGVFAATSKASAQARGPSAPSDPWAALRVFEGRWQGPTSGKPGKGSTVREYRFVLAGHFLSQRDSSIYQTGDPARPLLHEDVGMLSYDAPGKQIVWRQFHSEGLVNEYTLSAVAPDGSSVEFVTTRIENLPGFRAKKVYRIVSHDQIEETFFLAPPDHDFAIYTTADLRRVN